MPIEITVTPSSTISIEMAQYGMRGEKGDVGNQNFNITAAEIIGGHRAVLASGYYATSTGTLAEALCIGISSGSAEIGTNIDVQPDGKIIDMVGWNWTSAEMIYLSTAGGLTQTIPTPGSWYVTLGVALSATSMLINIQNPVLL